MKNHSRNMEVDFLKACFITLMVIFHLVHINQLYPDAKAMVYLFHMPAFLILSGFFANPHKGVQTFMKKQFWLCFPYIIMETGYVIAASLLPIYQHIEHLTLSIFIDKLFLHPIGPYWYIHTLLLCGTLYYLCSRLSRQIGTGITLILYLALLSFCALELKLLRFEDGVYFFFGVLLRQANESFDSLFKRSWVSIPLSIGLMVFHETLYQPIIYSILLSCSLFSALRWCFDLLPQRIQLTCCYIGRNTLPILLFSPVFTLLAKGLVPFFSFDPTGITFGMIATTLSISGSFAIARALEVIRIAPYFYGKEKILT